MASTGTVACRRSPSPADYTFDYKQKAVLGKKQARSTWASTETASPGVSHRPPDPPPQPGTFPSARPQLHNVLDPLSGVMALSLGNAAHPCERKIPIFDGKQRFDLVFTPARCASRDEPRTPIRLVATSSLVPISGHKPGEGTDRRHQRPDRVVLRPVPRANMFIPYR